MRNLAVNITIKGHPNLKSRSGIKRLGVECNNIKDYLFFLELQGIQLRQLDCEVDEE
jgi:hypothetical protein